MEKHGLLDSKPSPPPTPPLQQPANQNHNATIGNNSKSGESCDNINNNNNNDSNSSNEEKLLIKRRKSEERKLRTVMEKLECSKVSVHFILLLVLLSDINCGLWQQDHSLNSFRVKLWNLRNLIMFQIRISWLDKQLKTSDLKFTRFDGYFQGFALRVTHDFVRNCVWWLAIVLPLWLWVSDPG